MIVDDYLGPHVMSPRTWERRLQEADEARRQACREAAVRVERLASRLARIVS